MKTLELTYKDGAYHVDIDITVDEWKEMLQDPRIFTGSAMDMVLKWYHEPDHRATHKAIMEKYQIALKGTPFNGIVNGLSTRILKHLNRFTVKGVHCKQSKFSIPFYGRYVDYVEGNDFEWKLRDELAQAMEELHLSEAPPLAAIDEALTSYAASPASTKEEGKRLQIYTTRYERNPVNREAAIALHGTTCQACGFNFERFYGPLGRHYVEVHHVKPLSLAGEPAAPDPQSDLVCLCANCHRMIHRNKNATLSVEQLKKCIKRAGGGWASVPGDS